MLAALNLGVVSQPAGNIWHVRTRQNAAEQAAKLLCKIMVDLAYCSVKIQD